MKDQLISFETAVLAKEKGFKEQVYGFFKDGKLEKSHWTNSDETKITSNRISAPTQSLLQKWLREERKIVAQVTLFPDEGYIGDVIKLSDTGVIEFSTSGDDNYETALEEVLQQALKLI